VDNAEGLAVEAYTILSEGNDDRALIMVASVLADVCLRQRRIEEALALYQTTSKLLQKYD